tara:strand:+ start:770 stop:985 length:216 start_codon:yes stop_codon:yes gene_type:complete
MKKLYFKHTLYVRKENSKWLLGTLQYDFTAIEQGNFNGIDDLTDTIVGLVKHSSHDSIKSLLLVNSQELDT